MIKIFAKKMKRHCVLSLMLLTRAMIDGSSSPAVCVCVPKTDKTAVIIGQDYYSVTNYTNSNMDNLVPYGAMEYASLLKRYGNSEDDRSLDGLQRAINYGSGVEWIDGIMRTYPQSAIQLGVYLVGLTENIVEKQLDHNIQLLLEYIASHSSTPFYVRLGYEFDYFNNHYEPVSFVAAFQRVVAMARQMNLSNAAFVWHYSGLPLTNNLTVSDWFPGTDYLDWCGVSIFTQPFTFCTPGQACSMPELDSFAAFCKEKQIPIMIAESTPFGGITEPAQSNATSNSGSTWEAWFLPVMAFIEQHDVRMWSYINCNWDAQPMWAGQGWGDTRLEAHPATARLWKSEVLRSDRFLVFYPQSSADRDAMCEPGHPTAALEPPPESPQSTLRRRPYPHVPGTNRVGEVFVFIALIGAVILAMAFFVTVFQKVLRVLMPYIAHNSDGYVTLQ